MSKINKNNLPFFLIFIYLYSSLSFSIIYFNNIAKPISVFFSLLNFILISFITIGSSYYIYKDFQSDKYIEKNSNSKLFLIFFIFCIVASIINGNGFQKYNNIYFIIHSAVFFYLALQNNYNKKNYFKIFNFIIVASIIAISIISILTILIFLCNKFNITETFKNQSIKNYFYYCAPVNSRWYTILSNPNTFGHLVSMSFILAVIPIIKLKKFNQKVLIIIMQLVNFFTLFFSGSKGAILALGIGLILSLIIVFVFMYKNINKKILSILLLVFSMLLVITILLLNFSHENEFINFLKNNILRTSSISKGSGRFGVWKSLINLPLWSKPFGYSDNYIYQYMKSLNIYDFDVFLNNNGRAHNIYIQVLVSFGSIGFVLFISCLLKTFAQVIFNYKYLDKTKKILYFVLLIQFIVILIGGLFEQLPIFNMSAHSLFFMFVWANLLIITEKPETRTSN